MKNRKELPLRIGVGIALLNHENKVFVGKRIDNPTNSWQMPQGGIDQNENFLDAAKRELEEETGIKSVKLKKELDGWFKYDLPKYLLGKLWKGKY
ncbi:MAG: NUDIX domain-containing protein, partial [Pelagibacteraceae bacterium]|nr:NUDIX domain-containing protein [Pelagibacteraceae bacterium]